SDSVLLRDRSSERDVDPPEHRERRVLSGDISDLPWHEPALPLLDEAVVVERPRRCLPSPRSCTGACLSCEPCALQNTCRAHKQERRGPEARLPRCVRPHVAGHGREGYGSLLP